MEFVRRKKLVLYPFPNDDNAIVGEPSEFEESGQGMMNQGSMNIEKKNPSAYDCKAQNSEN